MRNSACRRYYGGGLRRPKVSFELTRRLRLRLRLRLHVMRRSWPEVQPPRRPAIVNLVAYSTDDACLQFTAAIPNDFGDDRGRYLPDRSVLLVADARRGFRKWCRWLRIGLSRSAGRTTVVAGRDWRSGGAPPGSGPLGLLPGRAVRLGEQLMPPEGAWS